ncbi:MAG: hypothetical protein GY909_02740 [Oligoflexia bacterium]|nr:hypothetical protein [Oligoflexia bacterium]
MKTDSYKTFTRGPLKGALFIFSLLFLLESCASVDAVKNSSAEGHESSHSHTVESPANSQNSKFDLPIDTFTRPRVDKFNTDLR